MYLQRLNCKTRLLFHINISPVVPAFLVPWSPSASQERSRAELTLAVATLTFPLIHEVM
jgi:hypothetical protein